MTIKRQIQVVERLENIINNLKPNYANNPEIKHELFKLETALERLLKYLRNLDELKPNYNTNEIQQFIEAVNVNLVILKAELQTKDYAKLSRALQGTKTILKYHQTRPSFLQFLRQWLIEFFYFI